MVDQILLFLPFRYVNSLPEEPYKRASLTLQQDVVSSFSRRTLQRRAEGEGIQLSQSALPLVINTILAETFVFMCLIFPETGTVFNSSSLHYF